MIYETYVFESNPQITIHGHLDDGRIDSVELLGTTYSEKEFNTMFPELSEYIYYLQRDGKFKITHSENTADQPVHQEDYYTRRSL